MQFQIDFLVQFHFAYIGFVGCDHKTNWICDMISMSFGIMELTLTIFDRYSMAVNMNGK